MWHSSFSLLIGFTSSRPSAMVMYRECSKEDIKMIDLLSWVSWLFGDIFTTTCPCDHQFMSPFIPTLIQCKKSPFWDPHEGSQATSLVCLKTFSFFSCVNSRVAEPWLGTAVCCAWAGELHSLTQKSHLSTTEPWHPDPVWDGGCECHPGDRNTTRNLKDQTQIWVWNCPITLSQLAQNIWFHQTTHHLCYPVVWVHVTCDGDVMLLRIKTSGDLVTM